METKIPEIWVKTGVSDPKYEALHRYRDKKRKMNPRKEKLPGPRYASGGLKKPTQKPTTLVQRKRLTKNAIRRGHLAREMPDPEPRP